MPGNVPYADLTREEAYAAIDSLEAEGALSHVRVMAGDAGGFYLTARFMNGGMVGRVEIHDMTDATRNDLLDSTPV